MNKVIWEDPKVRFKKHAELMTLRAGRDALRAENEKLNAQVEEALSIADDAQALAKDALDEHDAAIAALEAVEWIQLEDGFMSCPWCGAEWIVESRAVHRSDCQRQAALKGE